MLNIHDKHDANVNNEHVDKYEHNNCNLDLDKLFDDKPGLNHRGHESAPVRARWSMLVANVAL